MNKHLVTNPAITARSLEVTHNIFDASCNIEGTRLDHCPRLAQFEDLGIGDKGYTSFTPTFNTDFLSDFLEVCQKEVSTIYNELTITSDNRNTEWLEKQKRYELQKTLKNSINNENIINNDLPNYFINYCKNREIKGFSSPKLSKALVNLFGEKSSVVKWFTSQNFKNANVKGDKYRIYISALESNVAGMSYFAKGNYGGEDWDSFSGTSCQDTNRNGDGCAIYHLPASTKEETVCVAWLTYQNKVNEYENELDYIFENPYYIARALIRLITLPNGKHFFVVCRQYGAENKTKDKLLYGLLNQYKNVMFNADSVLDNDGLSVRIKHEYENILPCHERRTECEECRGEGAIDDECGCCDGLGEITFFDSYDNRYDCDCKNCDGDGNFVEECESCNGKGYISNYYKPYGDDGIYWHGMNFEEETGFIRYSLPIKFLREKGFLTNDEINSLIESAS